MENHPLIFNSRLFLVFSQLPHNIHPTCNTVRAPLSHVAPLLGCVGIATNKVTLLETVQLWGSLPMFTSRPVISILITLDR